MYYVTTNITKKAEIEVFTGSLKEAMKARTHTLTYKEREAQGADKRKKFWSHSTVEGFTTLKKMQKAQKDNTIQGSYFKIFY